MRPYTFGIVSEGPTDFDVITHIIMEVVPDNHTFLPIQPDLSETEGLGSGSNTRHSNGWRGVLSWCEASSADMTINDFLNAASIDILIIQVDADISRESEINCAKPCPQAEDTVIEIEKLIKQKLKINDFDDKIICCVPSDSTESWILTGLDDLMHYHGGTKFIECTQKPDDILSKLPFRAIRRKDGKAKKNQVEYREKCVPVVIEKWDYIRTFCSQAEKLHQRLLHLN
ncbi:hypothetical protein [Paenibacillus cymbidii]|uniref:hypothetical protein n=1 Tax=Paenibacillus cymbidii TaxID=1639034 RepID=UPI0010822ECA|nr:hypothetical protein [Paenibacillus cymbidii]